jgi:hypothetical protein
MEHQVMLVFLQMGIMSFFTSNASNLVEGDTNNYCDTDFDGIYDDNCSDIFIHDLITGETMLVSYAKDETQGNSYSAFPTTSSDGHYVAFMSWASNLVPGDTNEKVDIFVRDRGNVTDRITYESRNDIGMPYPKPPSTSRGCPSPFIGCGGSFHGFYLGVCTDLVLDSYKYGVPFNIQSALIQDDLIHPERYRYHSARNAEDMRQYFYFNQSLLDHIQPYQVGDIAFFDWDGDGITNHALIISSIDGNDRPITMVDASGIIPNINPSGLAFEHNWSNYYEVHIQGHARLLTNLLSVDDIQEQEILQMLVISVNSPLVRANLYDTHGKFLSSNYDENAIPYIPRGYFQDLDSSSMITVTQPLSNTNQYILSLYGEADVSTAIQIETIQNGVITAMQIYTPTINAETTQSTVISLSSDGGIIGFESTPPSLSPSILTPDFIVLDGLINSTITTTFTISESSGQQGVDNAVITLSDLSTQYGTTTSSEEFSITPSTFSIGAGGEQQVNIQINTNDLDYGNYIGGLTIISDNGNPIKIPFLLYIHPYYISLPLIGK